MLTVNMSHPKYICTSRFSFTIDLLIVVNKIFIFATFKNADIAFHKCLNITKKCANFAKVCSIFYGTMMFYI